MCELGKRVCMFETLKSFYTGGLCHGLGRCVATVAILWLHGGVGVPPSIHTCPTCLHPLISPALPCPLHTFNHFHNLTHYKTELILHTHCQNIVCLPPVGLFHSPVFPWTCQCQSMPCLVPRLTSV